MERTLRYGSTVSPTVGQQEVKKEKLGLWDQQLLMGSGLQAFLPVSLPALHACMGKSLPLYGTKCRKENFLEMLVMSQMGSAWNKNQDAASVSPVL